MVKEEQKRREEEEEVLEIEADLSEEIMPFEILTMINTEIEEETEREIEAEEMDLAIGKEEEEDSIEEEADAKETTLKASWLDTIRKIIKK